VQLDGAPRSEIDADAVQILVREAFSRWASVECPGGGSPGFQAIFEGFVTCDRQQVVCGGPASNVNTVMFREDDWPRIYPQGAAGTTNVIADLTSGDVWDADIELNGVDFSFGAAGPDSVDLSLTLTHEIGHFLGLSHSGEPGALMGLAYDQRDSIILSADDIAGICEIFPPRADELTCTSRDAAYDACAEDDLSSGAICPVTSDESEQSQVGASEPEETDSRGGCSWVPRSTEAPYLPWTLFLLLTAGSALRLVRRP
jgi:hypothetical protein